MTRKRLKSLYRYLKSGHFQNRKTGHVVKGQIRKHGYVQLSARIDGEIKHFQYHRMVWLYHKGRLPKELDHKNRVKTDNRIENLRPSNRSKQMTGIKQNRKPKLTALLTLLFLAACAPKPPDVPACEHMAQRLTTDPVTGHMLLTPSPTCVKQIGEPECGHCVWIVSGKEAFIGENKGHWLNGKPWSKIRQQSVYLPAAESYAPLSTYIINSCDKMGCSDDVDKFKIKLNSLNGIAGAISNP